MPFVRTRPKSLSRLPAPLDLYRLVHQAPSNSTIHSSDDLTISTETLNSNLRRLLLGKSGGYLFALHLPRDHSAQTAGQAIHFTLYGLAWHNGSVPASSAQGCNASKWLERGPDHVVRNKHGAHALKGQN